MKKGLKIAGIVLGIIIIGMFILPFVFQGKIEQIVKTEGNKILIAQFDFSKLDISLFRNFPKASVTLHDLCVRGINEFKNDTLVRAGEITAAVDLLSLVKGDSYDISKIILEDIKFHAIVLQDGKVNWDIMKPGTMISQEENEKKTTSSPFNIRLHRFVIKNMEVIYEDQPAKMQVDIHNLNLLCSGDFTSNQTQMDIEAETEALTYRINGIPFLSKANIYAKVDVDADIANNKYTLKKNEFRLNAIKASVDGWVSLREPAIDMDLNVNTNEIGFKEILSLIPGIYTKEFSSLKTDGTATLSAYAKGTLQGDTVPEFNIDMQIKNAMFRYPSLPAGVDQINVITNIKNPGGSFDLTTISIHPFSFRLAGNPFSITADISTPVSDPNIQVGAKGVLNLGMIKQVYPLEDMELNGTINADMQLSTCLSYIEKEQYERVQASGTIGLTGMKLAMKGLPDIEIKKSLLTFTPKYLQLSETTVNIGANDLTADSRFENYLGYALKGSTIKGTLNIQSKYLNLNDFMTSVQDRTATAATEAGTIVSDSTGVFEVPDNIDFKMETGLKKVLFGKMTFNDINGVLTIKDRKVDMKNLSMNTMAGNVVMNGYYSTADINKPEMNAGFKLSDISFAQAYKELDMIQQMAPVFENLKGNFSGHMSIQTLLDNNMGPVLGTMQGNGSISTKALSLSGIKVIDQIAEAVKKPELKNLTVKDMTLDFNIKDGRVATQPFDIKAGEYVMNLSGTTGLDQTIDYSGKIKLPASVGDLSRLTTVDLKIGGTFKSPKVALDTKSMANQAVEAVKDKAISELGKKLGMDSTATANKDSIKKVATEKLKEKALDFLKKKK